VLNPANIHRSNRSSLSISIDPTGNLIVKAPKHLSDKKIYDFIKSKGDWIRSRQTAVAKNAHISQSVASYNTFYFLGQELVPVISDKVKLITRQDSALLIPHKIPQDKILKKIEKYLKDNAKQIVQERCDYFSQVLRLSYATANTNNNKTRWGSCSKSREIAINWRAVMLKPVLLDYIVVHEFCHLLEFNHTKDFWAIVQTILPNWRDLRIKLKHMAWLLQLFRD